MDSPNSDCHPRFGLKFKKLYGITVSNNAFDNVHIQILFLNRNAESSVSGKSVYCNALIRTEIFCDSRMHHMLHSCTTTLTKQRGGRSPFKIRSSASSLIDVMKRKTSFLSKKHRPITID